MSSRQASKFYIISIVSFILSFGNIYYYIRTNPLFTYNNNSFSTNSIINQMNNNLTLQILFGISLLGPIIIQLILFNKIIRIYSERNKTELVLDTQL